VNKHTQQKMHRHLRTHVASVVHVMSPTKEARNKNTPVFHHSQRETHDKNKVNRCQCQIKKQKGFKNCAWCWKGRSLRS